MRLFHLFLSVVAVIMLNGCDPNHQNEFFRISRDDIQGYERFIKDYPKSILVKEAKERIETAKEEQRIRKEQERLSAEQRRVESLYGKNYLSNGSAPYEKWYGRNQYYDNYTPHSEIMVTAPDNSDVIVIVRYNNMNGGVAGHRYIRSGRSSTIYLKNGYSYQTFFYYGKGWYPEKQMSGGVRGGFVKEESYSKDGSPSYLDNQVLSYQLTLQAYGSFNTSSSSEGEMF